MYYEINVSKDGKHYFATHERSLTDSKTAHQVFGDFCRRFPASEGFKVSLLQRERSSKIVMTDEDLL